VNLRVQLELADAAESSSAVNVEVVNSLLRGLVETTRGGPGPSLHDRAPRLYGGDIETLVSLMSSLVKRSAAGLLPVLDNSTSLALANNISTVRRHRVRLNFQREKALNQIS